MSLSFNATYEITLLTKKISIFLKKKTLTDFFACALSFKQSLMIFDRKKSLPLRIKEAL